LNKIILCPGSCKVSTPSALIIMGIKLRIGILKCIYI